MSRTTHEATLTLAVSDERDHIQGPAAARVTLVEYGDFECPHCGRAHPIVKELQKQFASELRFVFRNFPLTQIHARAQLAAEAAEAAGAQGKFWQMHDALFENQPNLEPLDLMSYAEQLGLELPRFERELERHVYAPRVREDFLSGVRSGVNGTPSFFLNDARYDESWDLEDFAAAIAREIEAQGKGPRR